MADLFVLIGPQASGKTTWRRTHKSYLPVASSDEWFEVDDNGHRYWMGGESKNYWSRDLNPGVLSKAWAWTWQRYGELLKTREDFVFEGTFSTRISRSPVINVAIAFGYSVHCIWFNVPLEYCISWNRRRPDPVPDRVLARTYASMEEPERSEGWASIQPQHKS